MDLLVDRFSVSLSDGFMLNDSVCNPMNVPLQLRGVPTPSLAAFLSAVLLTFLSHSVMAADTHLDKQPPGFFENSSDVGQVKIPGSVLYDVGAQEYHLTASGKNMWATEDEFRFVYKKIKGDFIVTANLRFIGEGVDPHRKAGWTARNTLETGSPHVNASIHGDGLTSLQWRETLGGETLQHESDVVAPDVVQLERRGSLFIMSTAKFGEPFQTEEVEHVGLSEELYVGLNLCSHNPDVVEKAIFSNVRVTIPAWEGLQQYRDYLGSRLETINVATGHRQIHYSTSEGIEAPNWTNDGTTLLYNSRGKLYRYGIAAGQPALLDTNFATSNNNDHVLSFDGTMLGISHHAEEHDGNSIIYKMPPTGGVPEKLTVKGPSYLHGISPDNETIIYTAQRDGDWNIWSTTTDGVGEETQLTDNSFLDDGSEYSPDGKHIYFNSTRSGLMQLWRMNADGSNQEMVTDDEFNNWFPHISPDGKTIVFLSYGQDVEPTQHPYYKRVYLRSMPVSGGTPKVIAYLYGGQGTINVPSWSPDGSHVTFVSHTVLDTDD